MTPTLSVCIPAYQAASTIAATLESVLTQEDAGAFDLLVIDNASTDQTLDVVRSFKDPRLRWQKNDRNLGCFGNLEACRRIATTDLVVYLCADDILLPGALKTIRGAFLRYPEAGVMVRPYYWFHDDIGRPVRRTLTPQADQEVTFASPREQVREVLALSDQISGLAFRRSRTVGAFDPEPFVEAAGLVIPTMKASGAILTTEPLVAVRISTSGSMSPAVYRNSPMGSWRRIIVNNFSSLQEAPLRDWLVRRFVAQNYIGLVQIRNFAPFRAWLREVRNLVVYEPTNLLSIRFWFFVLGTFFVPPVVLRSWVKFYKEWFVAPFLRARPRRLS
jgi:glycosyltransferase involved in cell wall biosynthesis